MLYTKSYGLTSNKLDKLSIFKLIICFVV